MNPTAIYSKSGKGVQEAAGKTSLLKRNERAVLAAIDGRATLGEVAEKVGAHFDPQFAQLIAQLDRDGFIRQVTAGTPVRAAAAKPEAKAPASAADAKLDLDFSSLGTTTRPSVPPPQPVAMPAPPKPAARPAAPPMSPAERAKAEAAARAQQASLAKAREQAERKAHEERDRLKAEAEAKLRAEAEAKLRAQGEEEKKQAAAEAATRAAGEAKAKAEAEKARREAEELRQRLEQERKAREEAERKAAEQAERVRREAEEKARREAEELRLRLEEERRAREEAERRAKEEAERIRREAAASLARERAQRAAGEASKPAAPAAPKAAGFADLIADLDSFTPREDDAERKLAEEARRIREEAERKEKEDAERKVREEAERRAREEEQRRLQEEEQRRAREEEKRAREEEERRWLEEAEHAAEAAKAEADIPVTEEDLDMEDVRRDEQALSKEARDAAAERERKRQAKRAPPPPAAPAPAAPVVPSRPRRRQRVGKPIALALTAILLIVVAAVPFLPLATTEYEKAASEALGRPVSIGEAHLSLLTGPQLRLERVRIGEAMIALVRAHPDLATLHENRVRFSRIDLEGVTFPQRVLGELFGGKLNTASFWVSRVNAREVRLSGPLVLPVLEAELIMRVDGALASASVRGPENLMATIVPQGSQLEFDMTASSFAVPIAPDVQLGQFAMKGTATRSGMSVDSWGGSLYDGAILGTAKIRWGGSWTADGMIAARNINAGVFAPALLSSGKAEGNGRFSFSGSEPSRLGATGRVEGSFTISRGVLGAFDLSRAIQTAGRQAGGRTQFSELTGHAVFDRGAIALRNVNIGAGALNAGASADIAQTGALSGRVVADLRAANQTVRATINLSGTIREPQVRN